MNHLDHDQVAELLAAYALDAVEADEAALVDAHLANCTQCRLELARLREVTGLIANSGGDAPPHLWDAIAAHIDTSKQSQEPPAIRHVLTKAPQDSPPPRGQVRRRSRNIVLGAIAAAVVVVAVLAVEVGRLNHRVNQLQAATEQQQIARAADSALSGAQAQRVTLVAAHTSGPAVAQIAILPSGAAFLVNRTLPALARDETYQLWGEVGDDLVSLGVLGSSPNYVAFHVDASAPIASFALTVERAGGVVRSTHAPVAVSFTSS